VELRELGPAQQKIVRKMTPREQRCVLWDGWPGKVPYKVRLLRATFLWDLKDTGPWIRPSLPELRERYGLTAPSLSSLLVSLSDAGYRGTADYPHWIDRETHPEGRKTLRLAIRPGVELPPDPREPKTVATEVARDRTPVTQAAVDSLVARMGPASPETALEAPVAPAEPAPVALNGSGPVDKLSASDRAILIMRLAGEIFRDVDAVGPARDDDEAEGLRAEVQMWRERAEELESALVLQRRKLHEAEETAVAHKRAHEALKRTNSRLDENLRAILSGQKAPDNRDARMFRQLMEGKS
jgi:hypothetical protein